MKRFLEAFRARDLDAIVESLAPDVVINGPVSARLSFRGRDRARELFAIVLDILEDAHFEYEHEDGEVGVVVLRVRMAGRELHETQVMRMDAEGRERELTLFMRPLPWLAGLAAAIGPRLVRGRRGRVPAAVTAGYARVVAALAAAGDRAGARLI